MAPIPKKPTPRASAPKKERLSQSEATSRMLSAASQLLLDHAPGDVTVSRICEKAGVHTDYVVRYFGSRDELLCQAIEAAFLGVFLSTESKDISRIQIVLDRDVDIMKLATARVRTIAYLQGCGVDAERFRPSQKQIIESLRSQSTNPNVSDRARMNLVLIGLLIIQAMSTFSEMNDITEDQKSDIFSFIGYLSQSGESIQTALGWNERVKPTPKKKK